MQKFHLKIPYSYRKIVKDFTQLQYDVNDRVYSKSKSIQLHTDFDKKLDGFKRILNWTFD